MSHPNSTRVIVVPPTARAPRRDTSRAVRRENRLGWLYAAPTTVLLAVLFIAPIIVVVIMAASDWSLLGGARGANFPENFTAVFADPLLGESIGFTLLYTVITTVILMPIALGLALLVQEARKWNAFLRTAILLPSALGIASASLLFYAIYSPQIGPLNGLLELIGATEAGRGLLATPGGALWGTVFLVVWRFAGYYMLLMMVGLQAIPGDVYEAATLDRVSKVRQFFFITLPLLKPVITFSVILSISGTMQLFTEPYLITNHGGPGGATETLGLLLYRQAFLSGNVGYASAIAYTIAGLAMIVSLIQLRLSREAK